MQAPYPVAIWRDVYLFSRGHRFSHQSLRPDQNSSIMVMLKPIMGNGLGHLGYRRVGSCRLYRAFVAHFTELIYTLGWNLGQI